MYGSVGKKTMEMAQTGHHLWTGRYLAYLSTANIGSKIFLLSPWDKILRQAWKNRMKDVLRHPGRLFDRSLHPEHWHHPGAGSACRTAARICATAARISPFTTASLSIRAAWMNTACSAGLFRCWRKKKKRSSHEPEDGLH